MPGICFRTVLTDAHCSHVNHSLYPKAVKWKGIGRICLSFLVEAEGRFGGIARSSSILGKTFSAWVCSRKWRFFKCATDRARLA